MKRAFTPIPVMLGAILMTTAAPCAEGADSDRAYPIAVQQSVGSWTLIAANDQEGSFHHCELSQQQGDYQLSFLRGTAGYVLVVANAAWQLPEGATYQVSLDGDGLNPVDFKASTAGTGIIILLGDDWPLVAKMREIGTLRLHAAKAVIPLAMDEAAAGLDQLEACWTERTGAVSNPFADADAGATDANPFATGLADTAATGAGGFSIDASGIAASGSNFSAAEIGKMFEGDFARFAELTADTITVPEITTRFSGADENAQSVEVVYRDVRMSGVDRGEAAGSEVGSIELRSGETSVTLDHLSTGQLNIDGLLAFYGLVPSDQDADAPQLLYKDFAIGGVRIDLPGASCRLGGIEAAEFSARPLHVTPAESARILQQMQEADGSPTPEQVGSLARLYADYFTAFQSGPLQVSDLECSTENRDGETVSITADRLGTEGLQPSQIPGIEARNLKIEVAGEGAFAARALILKPADASGLVATLRDAGDSPVPDWLADNARALVPAFAGLQLADVQLDVPDTDAPGERLRLGLAEADLALDGYHDGIPTDVKMTAFGIDIPMTGEDMQPLADMGYSSLDLGVTLATRWDPAAGTIDLDQLVVSGDEMGTIALVGTLTNATADLFSGDGARALGAALLLGVQSVGLQVQDAGLRDRLIAAGAKSAGIDAKAFTKALAQLVTQYVPQGRDWTDEVEQAAVAFIKGAPSVTVGLGADTPVAAAQLLAAQSDPASLLDLFDVSARAGK